jgi:hypothetical protein
MKKVYFLTGKPFIANKVYLSDTAGNISGPYNNVREAGAFAIKSDVILLALDTSVLDKKKEPPKTIKSITIDFTNNKIKITGENKEARCRLNLIEYGIGEYPLSDTQLKDYEKLIDDSFNRTTEVSIIGLPPIEGESLDALLYM